MLEFKCKSNLEAIEEKRYDSDFDDHEKAEHFSSIISNVSDEISSIENRVKNDIAERHRRKRVPLINRKKRVVSTPGFYN